MERGFLSKHQSNAPDTLENGNITNPLNLQPPCEKYMPDLGCYKCGIVLCKNRKCRTKENCSVGYNPEHIPPKGLFAQNKGYNQITALPSLPDVTIAACRNCNNRDSIADEDFIFFITLISSDNPIASYAMHKKRFRQLTQNQLLRKDITQGLSRKYLCTPSGIELGGVSSLKFDPKRRERFFYSCGKIIRGIYYWHFKRSWQGGVQCLWANKLFVPFKYSNKLAFVPPIPEIQDVLNELNLGNRILEKEEGTIKIFKRTVSEGVFKYLFATIVPRDASKYPERVFFFLSFYDKTQFIFWGENN